MTRWRPCASIICAATVGHAGAGPPAISRSGALWDRSTSKETTIKFWWVQQFTGVTGKEDPNAAKPTDFLDWMLPKFNEKQPNIKVEREVLAFDDLRPKLNTAAAAGTGGPDIFYEAAGNLRKYAFLGVLESTDPYITGDDVKDFYPLFIQQMTVKGQKFFWPIFTAGTALVANRKLFQDLKVDNLLPSNAERTWDFGQFLEASKAVTQGDRYAWGLGLADKPGDYHIRKVAFLGGALGTLTSITAAMKTGNVAPDSIDLYPIAYPSKAGIKPQHYSESGGLAIWKNSNKDVVDAAMELGRFMTSTEMDKVICTAGRWPASRQSVGDLFAGDAYSQYVAKAASAWGNPDVITMGYLDLSVPGLTVLAIFTFVGNWNAFVWPVIVTRSLEMRTLPPALAVLQLQAYTDYGLQMAGSTFSAIPTVLLFLALQRYFLRGVTIGALKG